MSFFLVLLGLVGTFLIGFAVGYRVCESKFEDWKDTELKKFREQANEFTSEIEGHLSSMREGLIQTVRSYDKAVKTVERQAVNREEGFGLLPDETKIARLHLEVIEGGSKD